MSIMQLPEALIAADRTIALALNAWVGSVPQLDRFVSLLLNLPLMKSVPVIALLYWIWFGGDAVIRSRVLATCAAAISAFLAARVAAHLFPSRWRPLHDPSLGLTLLEGMNPNELQFWSSLPSDHAAKAGAMVIGLWLIRPRYGALAAAWCLAFILSPRVYAGLHFTSDILVGFSIGALVAVAASAAGVRRVLWSFADRWSAVHRPSYAAAGFLGAYLLATNGNDIRQLLGLAKQLL